MSRKFRIRFILQKTLQKRVDFKWRGTRSNVWRDGDKVGPRVRRCVVLSTPGPTKGVIFRSSGRRWWVRNQSTGGLMVSTGETWGLGNPWSQYRRRGQQWHKWHTYRDSCTYETCVDSLINWIKGKFPCHLVRWRTKEKKKQMILRVSV